MFNYGLSAYMVEEVSNELLKEICSSECSFDVSLQMGEQLTLSNWEFFYKNIDALLLNEEMVSIENDLVSLIDEVKFIDEAIVNYDTDKMYRNKANAINDRLAVTCQDSEYLKGDNNYRLTKCLNILMPKLYEYLQDIHFYAIDNEFKSMC